jgi:homopolymeric O-antigen transport system permease protein
VSSETLPQPSPLAGSGRERRRPSQLASVYADVFEGSGRWHLWRALAWRDIKGRYRRTVIGPFWTVLSTAILVATLGVVYSQLWHEAVAVYLPYFCAGYISWYLFSTIINESGTALIQEEATVKSIRVPYSVFIFRVITRNVVVFGHNLVIFIIVVLIFQVHWGWKILLMPLGLALSLPNYFWISLLLATVCARFRDVIQLVVNITSILFFVTPIFWEPSRLASSRVATILLVTLNPAYHLVEVIRAPLLGKAPGLDTYVYLVGMAIFGFAVLLLFLRRVYGRIAYWL